MPKEVRLLVGIDLEALQVCDKAPSGGFGIRRHIDGFMC